MHASRGCRASISWFVGEYRSATPRPHSRRHRRLGVRRLERRALSQADAARRRSPHLHDALLRRGRGQLHLLRARADRSAVEGWLAKTAHAPDFRFTVKLWQRFTHEREQRVDAGRRARCARRARAAARSRKARRRARAIPVVVQAHRGEPRLARRHRERIRASFRSSSRSGTSRGTSRTSTNRSRSAASGS